MHRAAVWRRVSQVPDVASSHLTGSRASWEPQPLKLGEPLYLVENPLAAWTNSRPTERRPSSFTQIYTIYKEVPWFPSRLRIILTSLSLTRRFNL